MQRPPKLPVLRLLITSAVLAAASFPAAAQTTLYWDVNGSTSGLGGTGTWQNGSGNWSTDTSGTSPTSWANANSDTANFRGTAGTVTLSGTLQAGSLVFDVGGYTLSGASLGIGRSTGSGNLTVLSVGSGGTGTTTISSGIVINDAVTAGTAATYTFNNSAATSELKLSAISLDYSSGTAAGNKVLSFTTGVNSGVISLDGSITTGTNGGAASLWALSFGSGGSSQTNALAINGTFYVNGNNTGIGRGTTINGGTVYAGNSNAFGTGTITFGSSGARGDMKLFTNGAYTISNALGLSGASTSQTTIGGATADDSVFSGNFNMNAFTSTPNPIFMAAAGGKVTFSGVLSATSPGLARGITIQGPGVVALSGNNTYKGITTVSSGTLLLMNTTGSAVGTAAELTAGTVALVVNSGARLGGTGTSTVLTGAESATSIFTPGDMTKGGVSSIGTLHLTGGLTATSGANFKFDINGSSIDSIAFEAGALTLGGTVTFDFTSLGPVNTGTAYSLFSGTGTWTGTPSFVFNAPAGYALDLSYNSGTGYNWDISSNSLTVQFSAIPEPSTTTMLGLGLAGALLRIRRRRC